MRLPILAVSALLIAAPIGALAQAPPPPPTPPSTPPSTPPQPISATGATATAVREAMATRPAAKPDGGSRSSAVVIAQAVLDVIREKCTLVENDGKLFAACDNTTDAAKLVGGHGYLPQLNAEWEAFTKRLVDADFRVTNMRRPVVVLNNGDVVAESTAGGGVKLKK
jgi:hypothetical protein